MIRAGKGARAMMSRGFTILLIAALASFCAACGSRQSSPSADGGANATAREVTVYVSTDRVFSEPVLRAYEQQTGVQVNAVYDTEETKSTGLANKLLAEQHR